MMRLFVADSMDPNDSFYSPSSLIFKGTLLHSTQESSASRPEGEGRQFEPAFKQLQQHIEVIRNGTIPQIACWRSTITMALSCIVSKILNIEWQRALESWLAVTHRANLFTTVHGWNDLQTCACVLALTVWVYYYPASFSSTQRAPEKAIYRVRWCVTNVQGHTRSSKLVPNDSPYVISYCG